MIIPSELGGKRNFPDWKEFISREGRSVEEVDGAGRGLGGWASCRGGCAVQVTALSDVNRSVDLAEERQPKARSASSEVEKQEIPVEIHASDLSICLQKLPASAGTTLRGVRRRQGEIYRRRAERSLFWAIQRYERTFFTVAAPGADLLRFLEGKKRYWQGGGGAAGYLRGTVVTAEGIAAARAYAPRRAA